MGNTDVVLAGGGIIGLSTAFYLAQTGARVTVLERGKAMNEASWAAAGMLAAHDPDNPGSLRPMSELSLKLYPAFLDEISRLSGEEIRFRTGLTLQGTAKGSRFSEQEKQHGTLLSPKEAEEIAPGLVTHQREFLLLEENSLDPRDLCHALPKALASMGVKIHEQNAVTGVEDEKSGLRVHSEKGSFAASDFVNCCGAWAGDLLERTMFPSLSLLGIEPRKGQIITVAKSDTQWLPLVIRTPETYLVPRGDGRVVIGATVERTGFNKTVSETTTRRLFAEAAALFPSLQEAEITQTWAGLRPGSADGLPLMGQWGPHRWIAAGHFRNGILLAPVTGHLMSQVILGKLGDLPLESFGPERFVAASA